MYPIYINKTKTGLDFDEFKNDLLKVCQSHQQQGRASAFAFIIYDFDSPHVQKVLFDDDYWDNLNKISGHYLTIFSLFDKPTKHRLNNDYPRRVKMSFEAVKVETKRDLRLSYNELMSDFFGGIDFPTPSILFFQVDNDAIIDHFFIELKEEHIENGFLEIKRIIKDSIEAVQDIAQENKNNHKEIFQMIQLNVESSIWWKKAKKVTKRLVGLINFLAIFK